MVQNFLLKQLKDLESGWGHPEEAAEGRNNWVNYNQQRVNRRGGAVIAQ